MTVSFVHRQSAHCESGVSANLLRHAGLDLTEAMAFGVGGGLNFAYLPMVKVNGLPLFAYRSLPGTIFKRAMKSLDARYRMATFRDPAEAEAALDDLLARNIPVGAQVGVFWLPFFPPALRFHFNSHNLVVYGREGDDYLISDPTLDKPVRCAAADLAKARFAQGPLAPKGKLYYLTEVNPAPDLPRAVRGSIRKVVRDMARTPLPFLGWRGIRTVAKRVAAWPEKHGERRAAHHLAHLIRMQEEIGTGGGGFRFIYAAFLLEAAPLLGEPRLETLSRRLTEIGDRWRDFAVEAARVVKGRAEGATPYRDLSALLAAIAILERDLFTELGEAVS